MTKEELKPIDVSKYTVTESGNVIKDNLKQEAEEKAGIYFDNLDYDHGNVSDTPFSGYDVFVAYKKGALDFALPREKQIAELEAENERIKTKYYELQDTLKKVRLALIKERTANIMNYGKGGVEMFDSMFEILKGVSN